MGKTQQYREIIQSVIGRHAQYKPSYGDVDLQTIFDTERDHYQLVHAGWHKQRRKYGCLIHMDIKNEKFWIQYDRTEMGVANELVARGVPKDDIVLAYQPEYKRPYIDILATLVFAQRLSQVKSFEAILAGVSH